MSNTETKRGDLVWLDLRKYDVVPLKQELAKSAVELTRAIQQGIWAHRDFGRLNFFDVELENRSVYIHVHPEGQAVYLLAEFGKAGVHSAERGRSLDSAS